MGQASFEHARALFSSYIDVQQMRMATEARLRGLRPSPITDTLRQFRSILRSEERRLVKEGIKAFEGHPVVGWCRIVKGLGDVAALFFLGMLNPHEATSAGKAWRYFGLAPGMRKVAGRKGGYNPLAKGRGDQGA